jgi:hypothetical protein
MNVAVEVLMPHPAEQEQALMLLTCFEPLKGHGYIALLQITPRFEATPIMELILYRIDPEWKYTNIGFSEELPVPEGKHTMRVKVEGGKVILEFAGHTLEAADATYTTGKAGIEAFRHTWPEVVNFSIGGVVVDTFKRNENPLKGGWHSVTVEGETFSKGKCDETKGWQLLPGEIEDVNATAIWTGEEEGEGELEPQSHTPGLTRGVVFRPLQ